MADTSISGLTAVTVPALTDLLPVVQTPGAGPKKATVAQIASLVGNVFGASIVATDDTYLESGATTTNENSADPMVMGGDPGDSSGSRPPLISFGISALAGKTIIRAALRMYRTNDDSNAVSPSTVVIGHRVLRAVVFNQTTWNVYSTGNSWTTAGARSLGNDISGNRHILGAMGTNGADVNAFYTFEVSALVQECVTAGDSTAILRVQYDEIESSTNATRWSKHGDATAAKRPTLLVLYI